MNSRPQLLEESLLHGADAQAPRSKGHWLFAQLKTLPSSAFLAILNDVYAASFGMLLIPASTGIPPSFGVPLYLFSVISAELGAFLGSDIPFATGGSTFELLPILVPMAELVLSDTTLDDSGRISNIIAMCSCTSLLIGLLYQVAGRFRIARLFRCIPLVVLKGALTSIGLFMMLTAVKMVAGHPLESGHLLRDPGALCRLVVTVALGVGLKLTDSAVSSPMASVAYLVTAAAAFKLLPALGLLPAGGSSHATPSYPLLQSTPLHATPPRPSPTRPVPNLQHPLTPNLNPPHPVAWDQVPWGPIGTSPRAVMTAHRSACSRCSTWCSSRPCYLRALCLTWRRALSCTH